MTRVHEGMADPGFEVPDSVEAVQICRKSGKLPIPGVCSADPRGNAIYTEYFEKGTAPTEVCGNHMSISVCGESRQRPTQFCPTRAGRTIMIVPPNQGSTDDSALGMPGYCPIHTGILPDPMLPVPSETDPAPQQPIGPGYVTPNPPIVVPGPGT